jgi:hypothetical protein
MQTAKIKAGETYAMERGSNGNLVRFMVQAIITTKTRGKTINHIEGYVQEEREEGKPVASFRVDPERLIGPYAEHAELVARKEQEQAAHAAAHSERQRLADLDRRMLYAFVGVAVPKVKPDEYSQMFRIGYSSGVDISGEGVKAIIAKVRALREETRGMEPQTTTTEHSPELLAAAKAQWKAEGKM